MATPRRPSRAPNFFHVCAGLLVLAGIRPVVASAQAPMFITAWGTSGSGNGQLYSPYDVAVDASGNKFGMVPTPAARETWGGVKARYRPEGTAKQDK